MNKIDHEAIKNKYFREIRLTKIRIIEKSSKLNKEEITQLKYLLEPRNKAEEEIKENYMGFITQRVLEGHTRNYAIILADICINQAICDAICELKNIK